MPSPTASAQLRTDLGAMTEFDLVASRNGFIAQQVAPVIDVQQKSGPYGIVPVEQLLADGDTERAPGSGYSRGKWTFTPATYACVEHGHEEPVDDEEARMYADYFDVETFATQRALMRVLRNAEKRMAAAIFNTTTWTGSALTTAATAVWSDATNGKPRTDVRNAMIKVWEGSGLWPNALICNRILVEYLKDSAEVIDRLKYSGIDDPKAANITNSQLAAALGIDRLIVAGAPKNTAKEGQSVTIAPIWASTLAMVAVVGQTQDIKEPCIAKTVHYSATGSTIGGTVETYREESKRSDIVRVRHDVDELVTYIQAGHLINTVTS